MSITSSKTSYKAGFQPLMPGCFFSQYPYCLHCDVRAAQERPYQLAPYLSPEVVGAEPQRTCCNSPLNSLENLFEQQTSPEETAAIIVEPIQGEGGIITPPADFLGVLRDLCDEHGILLIMDEVQSGAGRSGKWWAHEHWDVEADMMIFAKGIASGYQLAGIAARPEILTSPGANTLGGTYGGSAIASAAAVATIRTIREDRLLENTMKRGEQLCNGLVELSKRFPLMDVRGRGLMIGVELSSDLPAGSAMKVARACRDLDLLVLTAGTREVLRFLPPLTVSEEEIGHCLAILEQGMIQAFKTDPTEAIFSSNAKKRVGDRILRTSTRRSSIRDPASTVNGFKP
jgi:4-aminobutyrate aminotransferase